LWERAFSLILGGVLVTKLELMTVLRSLKKLHEIGNPEAALEVINEIIKEAENDKKEQK